MWILYTVISLLVILLIMAKLVSNIVFGKRCEGNPKLKYFTTSDFEGLNAKSIEFKSNKGQILRGNIYKDENIKKYKGLVLFIHGMGGGHLCYTTEINTLAKSGYIVMGYDNTGTCTSEGKSLKGLYQAVIDLDYALKFVETNEELQKHQIMLIGHSWGAYTVSQVLQFKHNIKAVVAMSGFNNASTLICDGIKNETNINFSFLKPFITIINFITFGKKGIKDTSDVLNNTDTPVLILHGKLDCSVPLSHSLISEKVLSNKENIKKILYEDKFHNVYQTKESEGYLNDVFGKIAKLKKSYKENELEQQEKNIYENIDYKKITEEDPEVMKTILKFLEQCQ